MSDGNPENFLFQGRAMDVTTVTMRGDSREIVESLPYPKPTNYRGLCERRKLPGGVWGGAPAANDFWTFCAIYACMQYASIIPGRQ